MRQFLQSHNLFLSRRKFLQMYALVVRVSYREVACSNNQCKLKLTKDQCLVEDKAVAFCSRLRGRRCQKTTLKDEGEAPVGGRAPPLKP